ncbi:STAS domain-containing protein [Streptomyces sp. ISL-96]|uniref:STAS domain-containing protein n=1 Tax=Streptomyces sp. ISL-96 TaxID=2819191 RepID=UPI001BE50616|nr:STAS domain-containing protein [Streptomyces sp. ISL-96]MBT2487433.1 STAS domain-containing protein [Streptomyces sp. ISL-96]
MSYSRGPGLPDVDATMPAVLVVVGRVTPADVPRLCDELDSLLYESGATEVICDVTGLTHPDLTAVDALARLRLTARKAGCRLRLCGARQDLLMLLRLVGLSDVA